MPALMERGAQQALQGSVVLGVRRGTLGHKVTKEKRETRCWWEDLREKRATKENRVIED